MTPNTFQLNTANSRIIQDGKESAWQERSRMIDHIWHIDTLQDMPHLSIINLNNQELC